MLKSSVPAMLQIHTVCVYFDEKLSRVSKSLKTFGKTKKGSFNNYVDKLSGGSMESSRWVTLQRVAIM